MFILNALLARLAIMNGLSPDHLQCHFADDAALKQIGFKQNEITKISRTISFGG